ncbi:MAG: hypothetical protein NDI69_12920 [Bacteriovoracaceae bacterium]|nr:hypothetical protein [Bacteriovoracaceae bacterium]
MKHLLLTSLMLVNLIACQSNDDSSPVSSIQSYPVSMQLGGYTTASLSDLIIPKAHAAVSDLTVCFKRLRFKKDINDVSTAETSNDNIDLMLGLVTLSDAGTSLGNVSVPAGTYYRIEFDLESDCNGSSASLTNDFGVYNTNSRITIKFEGTFIVDGSESLVLGVQDILNGANAYNGVGDLKDALESISGSL